MEANESNCHRGCDKNSDSEDRKDYGAAFGEAVANIAIDAMKEEEAPKSAASAFIRKCESENVDPMEVVKRVAKRYEISVSSEIPPKEDAKRHVYYLLREVTRQVMSDIARYSDNERIRDFTNGLIRHVFRRSFIW